MNDNSQNSTARPANHGPLDNTSANTLIRLRWVWLALLAGNVLAVAQALAISLMSKHPAGSPGPTYLPIITGISALILPALGYGVRLQTYKRFWVGHRVTAEGYFLANVFLYCLIEVAAVLGAIELLTANTPVLASVPVFVCLIALAANFPHGRPMRVGEGQSGEGAKG